jgi:hypothetical protein
MSFGILSFSQKFGKLGFRIMAFGILEFRENVHLGIGYWLQEKIYSGNLDSADKELNRSLEVF